MWKPSETQTWMISFPGIFYSRMKCRLCSIGRDFSLEELKEFRHPACGSYLRIRNKPETRTELLEELLSLFCSGLPRDRG